MMTETRLSRSPAKQVLLLYATYALATAASALAFEVFQLNRWLDYLSNTKWYFPHYRQIFSPTLFLTGALVLSAMVRIRSNLPRILAAAGHGVVVAVICYNLVYVLDGNFDQITRSWRLVSFYNNLEFHFFVGAGPLFGWLYSGILWGFCALIAAGLGRWTNFDLRAERCSEE